MLLASLYMSEGAPIGYLWWTLPTKLRALGVAVDSITLLTSLLVLPWAFKFVWAPLVDTLRSASWGRRHWIVSAQIMMGLTLLPLLALPLTEHLWLAGSLLLLHAFTAATQDVAVDALTIATVPTAQRGSVNGWMQVGMLGGRATFGGAALYAERLMGERGVIVLLIVCIWFSMSLVLMSREEHSAGNGAGLRRFGEALRATLRQRATWLGLAFAALGGVAFESVGAVGGPLLIDRGLSKESVGVFYALPVVACMAIGALLGGRAADRRGHAATVGLLLKLMVALVAVIALICASRSTWLGDALVPALVALYLCGGAFAASSYAMFMDLTDSRLGATQFSAFMGATNLCEAWAALAVGQLIAASGYTAAFMIMGGLSLTALPIIRWLAAAHAQSGDSPTIT